MNTYDKRRAEARSRASRRLRTMTIGTAVLGVAATGALGWLAAATYDGSTSSSTSAAVAGTSSSTTSSSTTSGAASAIGGTGSTSAAVTAPIVTNGFGNAHVSSGGS